MATGNLTSWGRLAVYPHHLVPFGERQEIAANLLASLATGRSALPYGMGRSYGDACLNPQGNAWLASNLNRYINFDPITGQLECEAGVTLQAILQDFVVRGWMLPVTPGTQFVTVGGAIANDVHGKNHHLAGSFANSLIQLKLMRSDGEVFICSAQENQQLFSATIGGVGLTGLIISAKLQLRPITSEYLLSETIAYYTLAEFFQLADSSEQDWEYTVSWIDCLSAKNDRLLGLFMRGQHISQAEQESSPLAISTKKTKHKSVPLVPPFSLINALSLRCFNAIYFQVHKNKGSELTHYQTFFYPLDHIQSWNKLYGPRGFYQYQCVLPRNTAADALSQLLRLISKRGQGSFLAVLKTFGNKTSTGMLSFPLPSGVTLALDFPNLGSISLALFAELDAIVAEAGGRIYLAKDARMDQEFFFTSYPRLNEFLPLRDPHISSALSRRLMGY